MHVVTSYFSTLPKHKLAAITLLFPFKKVVYLELPGERELQESPKFYSFLHGDFRVNTGHNKRTGLRELA